MKSGKLRVGADWMHQRQNLSEEFFFKHLNAPPYKYRYLVFI